MSEFHLHSFGLEVNLIWFCIPFGFINNLNLFFPFQLSSKCDNRLFIICFRVPKLGNYPFLETSSHPIRCISRSRNTRLSTLVWKRSTSADGPELQHSAHEAKASPIMKRFRLGHDKISVSVKVDPTSEQPDEESNFHARTTNQVLTFLFKLLLLLLFFNHLYSIYKKAKMHKIPLNFSPCAKKSPELLKAIKDPLNF